jgi:outer membrane protein assembly factor BamB
MRLTGATLSALLIAACPLVAADWPQFRGPGGSAISDDSGLPVTWSSAENVVWKTELPGFGGSSPVTFGNQIFLTCYSGYGTDQSDPGDQQDLRRHVLAADRATGKILWTDTVEPKLPEQEYRSRFMLNGYATSTPATDGRQVFVFFGKSGVLAYTVEGRRQWQADVGSRTDGWGSATSPVLYEDLVIINASVESGSLVALDKQSGQEVWRARGIRQSWNTPILVDAVGKQELVVSVQGKLLAFDPASGEPLWTCNAINDYVCPSVVAHKGVVYAIGGRQATAVAVRAGGRGDVTDSHRLWLTRAGSNVSSPVYHDGHLYWVSDRAIAHCLKADTGEIVYQERLPRIGLVYSSSVIADGKLYAFSRENGAVVLAASPEFKLLAQNDLSPDDSIFNASPAISNGQILIRSDRYLYCLGEK